jgi:hypothetical protein
VKLRQLLIISAALALMTLTFVSEASGATTAGKCFSAKVGIGPNYGVIQTGASCTGDPPPWNCTVKVTAYIFGYFDYGDSVSASSHCGTQTVSASAKLPPVEDMKLFDGPNSSSGGDGMSGSPPECNFTGPTGPYTFWYLICEHTKT